MCPLHLVTKLSVCRQTQRVPVACVMGRQGDAGER